MAGSAKYRNVQANPNVAFVVDEVTENSMEGAHFLEIRGMAETAVGTHDPQGHLAPELAGNRVRLARGRLHAEESDAQHGDLAGRRQRRQPLYRRRRQNRNAGALAAGRMGVCA